MIDQNFGRFQTKPEEDEKSGALILQNIASFLSLADATSIAAISLDIEESCDNISIPETPSDSAGWSAVQTTPPPALVALSPNPDGEFDEECNTETYSVQQKKRSWAQEQLAMAVFTHPNSVRSFCVHAHLAAEEVRQSRSGPVPVVLEETPETLVEPSTKRKPKRSKRKERITIIRALFDQILHNIPLSVLLDILEGAKEISLDTSFAAVRITGMTIHGLVHALVNVVIKIWDGITSFNPLALFQMIVSHPFSAMGKTTEVVVSGIQSVATGVGSASSLALHRLSAKTVSSSATLGQQSQLRRCRSSPLRGINKKLLRRLNSLHSAAPVISYTELADDTGGLSRHAKNRVQRMMHYDVSLRPFVATVKLPLQHKNSAISNNSSLDLTSSESQEDDASTSSSSPCTPQSFPPTPSSRRMVLARGIRFSDDVVFLARDELRVYDALDSENERTREMAKALQTGKRLAVFDADDASTGIELTCGQHVATKVGNMLYCSTRSMVPILRNCFVYFEMAVLPRPGSNLIPQASMATLSIGLSTKEMPHNTLVGAWGGSVGLCTTGQILTAGQWCSPANSTVNIYGDRATVGCLVCLDDSSAFQTWDGMMVTAAVTFIVNERIVSPPVSTLPMGTAGVVAPAISDPQTPQAPVGPVPPSFTLTLLVPAEEELFPTVTLHSPGTAVMCRFSAGDVTATSRESIGAPNGVTVYAVDGSVIFD